MENDRLTTKELSILEGRFTELLDDMPLFEKDFSKLSTAKQSKLISPGSSWAFIYELPYQIHLISLLHAMGLRETVQAALKTEKPSKFLMNALEPLYTEEDEFPDGLNIEALFLLCYPLIKTLVSWTKYGKTLSKLVEEVRETENQTSLFKAVRVDRSIVSNPTIAHFISKMEIEGNTQFFNKLKGALSSKEHDKKTDRNQKFVTRYKDKSSGLRFILLALEENNQLSTLKGEERYRLFCEELELYPVTGKEDPFEALNKYISRWMKTAEVYRT